MAGYSARELVDNRIIAFGQLIHADDRETVKQEIESARRENRPYGCIYRVGVPIKRGNRVWGFEPNGVLENGGLGLINMRERAEMFDGKITVQGIIRRRGPALNESIRILSADDHAVVWAGLEALIETEEGMEVIGAAANGAKAVSKAAQLQPDVILLDLQMP